MSQDTIPKRFRERIKEAKEQQLEKLDLSNEQLTQIPNEVFELIHLKKLNLSDNKLTNLPECITNLSNLTELYLSDNKLNNLPESIGKSSNLTGLDLRGNQLTNLPESIGNLSNLDWLYLSGNQLNNLPESIGKLSNLYWLYLSGNQLINLPESIGNLSNLDWLYLNDNKLTSLPESIGKLSNLTELKLTRNQLTNLPESITNLSNLELLNLSHNQLTNLPKSMGNFSNLTELNLGRNQLTNLPKSIGNLSNLTKLYLTYNPLETPPLEIANRGSEAIRKYFRQLTEQGIDYIYEAKLLIVGEGGAGKTTLAKKIEDPNYQVDSNEKSTEGIDITKWSFPFFDKKQKEREFKVNIWDFGGQEIYHATHQFFLTKRSLYALVADTRKDDTDFYYWLNVVELLSKNSPLLIVKNEKGDRFIDIDENSLRGRFENLRESLATNLKDNRGLNAILDSIKYHIAKLPHVGSALPKTWKRVRETLEQDPRNYISLEEYLQICQDNGFTQLKDKLQLSGYLHDLGVCLHFQDSPLLKNTVILKPEWGTDAVYKVLDDKQVINNLGRFTNNDLDKIWSDEQYLFKQAELLELMMRFKLCYQIPGTIDTYIAPQLLTKTKPEYNWDVTDNLILRYTYEFMPKGIITQFIVVMHQHIYQQQSVWRSGVLLNKDETLAEVIEYYDKRELKIRVSGKHQKDLLTIITHELDKIQASYHKLKYQKLIPCNCQTCQNSQNPYDYKFNELLERLNNNKLTIECGKPPYHEVQVFGLIDNTFNLQELALKDKQDESKIFQIKGDYIDRSRKIEVSGGTVTASGAAALGLGDISGTVANTINQLPSFDNEPNKKELKELLTQLQTAVNETDLDTEDKQETLEQINSIAQALQNPQDIAMKKIAKRAMKGLGGTAFTLPSDSPMVAICKQVSDLIGKIF